MKRKFRRLYNEEVEIVGGAPKVEQNFASPSLSVASQHGDVDERQDVEQE